MNQAGRTRADTQPLRSEIIAARRDGLPVNVNDLAQRHGVGVRTVTSVRREVDRVLASARERDGANRRTVGDFDGDRLRTLRCGGAPGGLWLTQEMLGKLAGKSRGAIGHLENGHRKPTIVTLNAIADALGVSPSELTTNGGPNGRPPA